MSGASIGSRRPVFTAIYNHYVNRMGLEAPELEKILYPDGTTPFTEGATRGGDEPGWQSLTFHNISTREEGKKAKEMNGDLEDGVYRFWNRNSKKTMVDRDGQLQSAEMIKADKDMELALEPKSNIVCFRYAPEGIDADEVNKKIAEKLLKDGKYYVVSTSISGKFYLRITIMNPFTDTACLDKLIRNIKEIASAS